MYTWLLWYIVVRISKTHLEIPRNTGRLRNSSTGNPLNIFPTLKCHFIADAVASPWLIFSRSANSESWYSSFTIGIVPTLSSQEFKTSSADVVQSCIRNHFLKIYPTHLEWMDAKFFLDQSPRHLPTRKSLRYYRLQCINYSVLLVRIFDLRFLSWRCLSLFEGQWCQLNPYSCRVTIFDDHLSRYP